MTANDTVLQHLESGLLTITMNRPERRNALNAERPPVSLPPPAAPWRTMMCGRS